MFIQYITVCKSQAEEAFARTQLICYREGMLRYAEAATDIAEERCEADMGRKPSNVREKIIQAAYEAIQEKGFAKTTLENIVQRAGLTRGAFYYYFSDKEEILRELEQRYESTYRHPYREIIRHETAYETLRSLFVRNILSKKEPNPYAVMFRYRVEGGTQLEDMRQKQCALDYDFIEIIASIIQQGIDDGEFSVQAIDAQDCACSIYMILLGYDTFLLTHGKAPCTTQKLEEWADMMADLALSPLREKP